MSQGVATAPAYEKSAARQGGDIPLWSLALRVFVIAIKLILAYWLVLQSRPFFYQRF